jgi:drug/metabolite transporter (DMT)-like permease
LRALLTLACVTVFQTVALGGWLLWRERGEIGRVFAAWRTAGLVGLTSMAGSVCWFTAFTLQTVAYVNALGQVELILSMAVSVLLFGERMTWREGQGLILLSASVLALVLVT